MRQIPRFEDTPPEEMGAPDVNPYIQRYWTHGPPIIRGNDAHEFRGQWHLAFSRQAPLVVEIGSGNGFYLTGMAAKHPERNYLGIELRYKRVMLITKKILSAELNNARILRYDAWCLKQIFKPREIQEIVTNHPDPWPKARHKKNRLLSRYFCEWVSNVLVNGGLWRIKTDFYPHIQQTLHSLEGLNLDVVGVSNSVHENGTPWPANDDVMTNYEAKFHRQGKPVYACLIQKKIDADVK